FVAARDGAARRAAGGAEHRRDPRTRRRSSAARRRRSARPGPGGVVILVLAEDDAVSLEALTFARRFGDVEAIAFEDVELTGYAARVHRVHLDAYAPVALAQAIVGLAPETVVAGGTDRGHEVLAHAAA